MTIPDFLSERLFVEADLAAGGHVPASDDQANYLRNVMRMENDAWLLVFNGRHGEWRAQARHVGKRGVILHVETQTREQLAGPDVVYLFAPLKRARLDYIVQKATEMGAARLSPVITRHTVAERVNTDRMRANAIEAAEQCGVLRVPDVSEPLKLEACLRTWDASRRIVFCDEAADRGSPLETLGALPIGPLAVLIGPEGGFHAEERASLLAKPFVTPIYLGPRLLRADTAAVAALALVNATLGDWR